MRQTAAYTQSAVLGPARNPRDQKAQTPQTAPRNQDGTDRKHRTQAAECRAPNAEARNPTRPIRAPKHTVQKDRQIRRQFPATKRRQIRQRWTRSAPQSHSLPGPNTTTRVVLSWGVDAEPGCEGAKPHSQTRHHDLALSPNQGQCKTAGGWEMGRAVPVPPSCPGTTSLRTRRPHHAELHLDAMQPSAPAITSTGAADTEHMNPLLPLAGGKATPNSRPPAHHTQAHQRTARTHHRDEDGDVSGGRRSPLQASRGPQSQAPAPTLTHACPLRAQCQCGARDHPHRNPTERPYAVKLDQEGDFP
jgi:hypothetical protein